ncbi:segregation/condensation protein A [Streptomyces kurssanovii]|uniref:Segregation and condensation protein A n=1 Tax=Streptomyces kurssanovii TaxID=67312 RepID=A0ABV3I3C7_9ACTN
MPPTDDPPGPSRRRALGRGPGASRRGAVSPTPPLPESGDAPPAPERPALRDVDVPAPPPDDSPTPSPPGRALRDDEGPGDGPSGPEGEGERLERSDAAAGAPAQVIESPIRPLPGAEAREPEGGDSSVPPLPEANGESPEPEVQALRDGPGGPEAVSAAPSRPGTGAEERHGADDGRFTVRLVNFEGPFDLLLQLISKHKLDVTEVALSKVTDEFMAYIRAMGPDWDLDQTTEFLVVAATLLDLKAARLLPAAEVEDEADLALLEARDLLFARLLQYRAYKQIADIFDRRLDDEARRYPRTVGLEAHLAELLPEVVISVGAEGFAKLAVKAMQPKAKPQVYVDHIHAPLVSVREQAEVVVAMLRERGRASFRELSEDAPDTLTVVARFLALLELYREKAVALDQEEALGELTVVWAGGGAEAVAVTDEFDQVVEEKQ